MAIPPVFSNNSPKDPRSHEHSTLFELVDVTRLPSVDCLVDQGTDFWPKTISTTYWPINLSADYTLRFITKGGL